MSQKGSFRVFEPGLFSVPNSHSIFKAATVQCLSASQEGVCKPDITKVVPILEPRPSCKPQQGSGLSTLGGWNRLEDGYQGPARRHSRLSLSDILGFYRQKWTQPKTSLLRTVLAASADPSRCNSTIRQNPPFSKIALTLEPVVLL